MARPFRFGEIHLTSGDDPSPATPERETPFCMAIIGNFSGRISPNPAVPGVADRRPVLIDRDNFDQIMTKLGVALALPIDEDSSLNLKFTQLDDFHPDHLYETCSLFSRLQDLRVRVADDATFPAVARELGLQATKPAATISESTKPEPESVRSVVSAIATASLLDATVEQTEQSREGAPLSSTTRSDLDGFVRRIVEPVAVAGADPRQAETLAMIDRALAAQMRALMHVPAFQNLEAAWRAVYFLVRRVETGSLLKVFLIDLSKEELAADLCSSPDLSSTGLYRVLVQKSVRTPGADPWALILGDYEFGPSLEDADLLGRLGEIVQSAGAPFLAAAHPRLLGCSSLAETPHPREWTLPPDPEGASAWEALQSTPQAAWIGLALPRFMLRLPYGKQTGPIDSFDFEEMASPPAHEDYLWGNPAFACALLLAQSFSEDGWDMRPGAHRHIDGLPLHVYDHDGQQDLKPCAEVLLTEDAAEKILGTGIMPIVSLKGQDSVQLLRFQSIASPSRALAGRWHSSSS